MELCEAAEYMGTVKKGIYNIGFNGGDETQFDADSLEDLQECWSGFCSENSIPEDCVDYVESAGAGK